MSVAGKRLIEAAKEALEMTLNPSDLMIDPPEGWKYGFPKLIPKEHQNRTIEWLVEQGYPKKLIDSYGDHFYCRYWKEPESKDEPVQKRKRR